MIPKIIHQIWVGEEPPQFIKEAMESVQKLNPDFEYKFWGNEHIPQFKLENVFKESLTISFAVNVMQLKILEEYGGLYIDADTFCEKPLNEWFQKYTKYPLSSTHIKNQYPDMGIVIAKPHLNYKIFLADYNYKTPAGFYWQRLKPHLIPEEEVGPNGIYLKDLQLNSWVKKYEESQS